jgi:spore coat protein CotH
LTELLSGAMLVEWLHMGRKRRARAAASAATTTGGQGGRALEIAASLPPPPLEESEAAGSDTILHSITGLLQQRCDRRSVPRKKMGRARGRGGAQVMYRKKQNDPVSCVMGGKGE